MNRMERNKAAYAWEFYGLQLATATDISRPEFPAGGTGMPALRLRQNHKLDRIKIYDQVLQLTRNN